MASDLLRITTNNTTVSSTVYPSGTVLLVDHKRALRLIAAGVAESIESVTEDIDDEASTAKWGARIAFVGAGQTFDLSSLTSAGASRAGGVTNFSLLQSLIIRNLGTTTNVISIKPGASNPVGTFLTGTTPAIVIPAGCSFIYKNATGITIDGTHKTLLLDPGSDTFSATIALGGTAT